MKELGSASSSQTCSADRAKAGWEQCSPSCSCSPRLTPSQYRELVSLPRSFGRRLALAAVLFPAVLFATATAEEARAKAFPVGFADFAFPSTDDRWLDQTVELDGQIVRINAYWRHIAL